MIKLAVSGCMGRMGQRITALALEDKDFEIGAVMEYPGHPRCHEQVAGLAISPSPEAVASCDVLIDFTTPSATMDNLTDIRR